MVCQYALTPLQELVYRCTLLITPITDAACGQTWSTFEILISRLRWTLLFSFSAKYKVLLYLNCRLQPFQKNRLAGSLHCVAGNHQLTVKWCLLYTRDDLIMFLFLNSMSGSRECFHVSLQNDSSEIGTCWSRVSSKMKQNYGFSCLNSSGSNRLIWWILMKHEKVIHSVH